jgi:cholesterol oxidase
VSDGYSLRFTEEMKGWFSFQAASYSSGAEAGREAGSSLMFHLTIETEDVDRFVADRDHVARAWGWVQSDVLGGRLPVERGVFNLFTDAGPGSKRMLYRLYFEDGVGHPLTLTGYKDVHGGSPADVWPETSTLYVSLLRGHVDASAEAQAANVGAGILWIRPLDFARQLTTFRVHGPSLTGSASRLAGFVRLFAGQLWSVFFLPARRLRA